MGEAVSVPDLTSVSQPELNPGADAHTPQEQYRT